MVRPPVLSLAGHTAWVFPVAPGYPYPTSAAGPEPLPLFSPRDTLPHRPHVFMGLQPPALQRPPRRPPVPRPVILPVSDTRARGFMGTKKFQEEGGIPTPPD